jgi:hypothetical protein
VARNCQHYPFTATIVWAHRDDGEGEANYNPNRHDEVRAARPVNLLPERAPENSIGVVALDLLAGPSACALIREQDWTLIVDDRLHDHVVEEATAVKCCQYKREA